MDITVSIIDIAIDSSLLYTSEIPACFESRIKGDAMSALRTNTKQTLKICRLNRLCHYLLNIDTLPWLGKKTPNLNENTIDNVIRHIEKKPHEN